MYRNRERRLFLVLYPTPVAQLAAITGIQPYGPLNFIC